MESTYCWIDKKVKSSRRLIKKVRKFCPPQIFRSLYFSIFNSHLSYGLSVWGFADQIYVGKIKAVQRWAICAIGNDDKSSDDIFIGMKILTFDDQLQYQLSSLMWDYDHDILPVALTTYFQKTSTMHSYHTRMATQLYGIKSFQYQGMKTLNELKNQTFYHCSSSKTQFLKSLKSKLILNHTI